MIPAVLLDDLAARLAALDDEALADLARAYDDLATGDLSGPARVGRALRRAVEDEWLRRRHGVAFRLDQVVEAVAALGDDDLRIGVGLHAQLRAMLDINPENTGLARVHETTAQLCAVEASRRRHEWRAIRRDALSDRVDAWWLDVDDAT